MSTIIVSAILLLIVALIIYRQVKNKKEGKSSCGCNCSTCALKDSCHTK